MDGYVVQQIDENVMGGTCKHQRTYKWKRNLEKLQKKRSSTRHSKKDKQC